MTEERTRHGGCLCGAVRYEMRGAPIFTHVCHCTDCQRLSGSAFGISVLIEADRVILRQGMPKAIDGQGESGKRKTAFFCADCGCHLWNETAGRPGILTLKPGSLNDAHDIAPGAHIWTLSKQPWVALPDDVPAFDKHYDAREVWPAASIERARRLRTDD